MTSIKTSALPLLTAFALMGHAHGAVVTDDFTSGYPSGGSGWLTSWNTYTYRGPTTATVENTHPFSSGGNYLHVNYTDNVNNSGGVSIVSRAFDPNAVSISAPETVSFNIRLDAATHWDSTNEILAVYAGSSSTTLRGSYAALTNTWSLEYDGLNGWQVLSGDGSGSVLYTAASTPLLSAADGNTVYAVTVQVDPGTRKFTVSISDGTRTENWGNGAFSFIDPSATTAGNYLSFYSHVRYGVSIDYSVDNVAVVPEASSLSLTVAGAIGIGLLGKGIAGRSQAKK